jgi:hypothetical protein
LVLVEWLSIQENCSNYFGGLDSNGKTSGNRKDTYHYLIRDLIKKENGEYYPSFKSNRNIKY